MLWIMLTYITCIAAMRWPKWCCITCICGQEKETMVTQMDPVHEISIVPSPKNEINESTAPLFQMRLLLPNRTSIDAHSAVTPELETDERPPLTTPTSIERPLLITPTNKMNEYRDTAITQNKRAKNPLHAASRRQKRVSSSRSLSNPLANPYPPVGSGGSTVLSLDLATGHIFFRTPQSNPHHMRNESTESAKSGSDTVNGSHSLYPSTASTSYKSLLSTLSGMHHHIHTWPYLNIRKKSGNETITTSYFLHDVLGSGQFGTVFEGHPEDDNNTRLAIKFSIIKSSNYDKSDAHNEFCLCQMLAKKQVNDTMDNVVRIVDTKSNHKNHQNKMRNSNEKPAKRNIEYFVVMEHCEGTLRSLIDKQLAAMQSTELSASTDILERTQRSSRFANSSSRSSRFAKSSSRFPKYGEKAEVEAMMITVNVLKQCVEGLKQLQSVFPNLRFNDFSPDNILVSDTTVPVSKDIIYKLSDFGKASIDKFKFGSAPYVSGVNEPTANETQDINSLSLIGLEVLSAFGSEGNALWEAISHTIKSAINPMSIPPLRDVQIEAITSEVAKGDTAFHNKEVTTFFQQLADFSHSPNVSFVPFDVFLEHSWVAANDALHLLSSEVSETVLSWLDARIGYNNG